jgi:hypothetical protein
MGETFLIAFGGRGRYDPAFPSARPWLYGIATNLVGQRRRQEAREYRLRAALGPPADQDSHADRVAERVTAQAMNDQLAGLPARDDLARKRAELLAATASARPRHRRALWGGVTAAGLAAAVAAVVVLTPAEDVVRPGPLSPGPEPEPVRILHAAAANARALPDVTPRPDQFVYSRTRLADGRENETWASVDGTHDGLAFLYGHEAEVAGCRNGKSVQKESHGRTVTNRCVPHPAAPADLPTDADAMLTYLHKSTYGEGDTLRDLGNEVVTLAGGYLRPAARAALYEAVAKVPGWSPAPTRRTPPAGRSSGSPGTARPSTGSATRTSSCSIR